MRTAVHARLRPRFHPEPAGGAAFVAVPRLPLEDARPRRDLEVALGLRHLAGAGVPRDFQQIGGAFVVRAIGPGARQLPVLLTVFGTTLHDALSYRFHASEELSVRPRGGFSSRADG